MSRPVGDRLRDISAACEAIGRYVARIDADADADMLFDALRIRLLEIGEAVKDLPSAAIDSEPSIPWADISRMRDQLAHRYFDTSQAVVLGTARTDVPQLAAAVERMLGRLG